MVIFAKPFTAKLTHLLLITLIIIEINSPVDPCVLIKPVKFSIERIPKDFEKPEKIDHHCQKRS